MSESQGALRRLPAVHALLALPEVEALVASYGRELITYCIRTSLEHFRERITAGEGTPGTEILLSRIRRCAEAVALPGLKKVINASGVVIHTNLGRAPLGQRVLENSRSSLESYCNLELDMKSGGRGRREEQVAELLKFLTTAEDALVVNNNAAAVMLVLRTFARRKEVLVSRGELVEIGGSFRIPDVMAASGCRMREVGTTNRTRIGDYRDACGSRTALLFKAHKSNYVISGFTEEAGLEELQLLGREKQIPLLYDLGSGLILPLTQPLFKGEPDVRSLITAGVDMVCFSGDKLLGGPQAGIICGQKKYISKLKKEPMLRALRVDKMCLAVLEQCLLSWMRDEDREEHLEVFRMLGRSRDDIFRVSENLMNELKQAGIVSEIEDHQGQCGGGSLPEKFLDSCALCLQPPEKQKNRSVWAEAMMKGLLEGEVPVLGILRQGKILFDLRCVNEAELEKVSASIIRVYKSLTEAQK